MKDTKVHSINVGDTQTHTVKQLVDDAKPKIEFKSNPVKNVNHRKSKLDAVELINDFVKQLNKGCEQSEIARRYEVTIKNTKLVSDTKVGANKEGKSKTIKLLMYDLETNERMTLFSVDYVFKNPSDVLNVGYQKILIRELLYTSFASTAFTLESTIKTERVNQLLNRQKENGQSDNGSSTETTGEV